MDKYEWIRVIDDDYQQRYEMGTIGAFAGVIMLFVGGAISVGGLIKNSVKPVRIASEDEKEILGEMRKLADSPKTKAMEEILDILRELKDSKNSKSDEDLLELVKKLQDKL